jgi:hypothetical protein
MKQLGFCLLALGAVAALGSRAGADYVVTGTLDGTQEVPPTISPATGTFSGVLTVNGPVATLMFTVSYSGLIGGDVVGASFHDAPLGSAGPDVRDYDPGLFTSPDGSFSGSWTSSDAQPLTPALVSELLSGNIYFEIDTQEFPAGEIRGQLSTTTAPEPGTLSLALLGAAGWVVTGLRRRHARSVAGPSLSADSFPSAQ